MGRAVGLSDQRAVAVENEHLVSQYCKSISSFGSPTEISMSEKQTSAEALTPQVEMNQVIIEWGPWPLWILAGVAVSSIAISSLSISFVALILGGVIGGVFVGFMPYLANRWRITRVRWWAWIFVNSILIMTSLLICAYRSLSGC